MEGNAEDMSVSATRDLTPGYERDLVIRRPTFWTSEVFLRRDGKLVKIEKPADAVASLNREWLLLRLRSDWNIGEKTYPAGALIAIELREVSWKEAAISRRSSSPASARSLASFTATRHYVLVTELDNVRSRVYVFEHRDGRWQRAPLPGVPEFGNVSVEAIDHDLVRRLLPARHRLSHARHAGDWHARFGPAEKLKQLPAFFDAESTGGLAARGGFFRRDPHPLLRGCSQGSCARRQ